MPPSVLEPIPSTLPEKVGVRYTRCAAAPTTSSLTGQLGFIEDEFKADAALAVDFISLSPVDPKLDPTRPEQFSLRHAGTKTAWARAQGARLRIVALSLLQGRDSIWVRADSGIDSLSQLRGRRLGVPLSKGEKTLDLSRSSSLATYEEALGSVGITLDQTTLVEIVTEKIRSDESKAEGRRYGSSNRELLSRLIGGEIDAITGNISAEAAEKEGLRQIFDSLDAPPQAKHVALRALVVHETLLEEEFETVVRILARHLQAAAWAQAHPEEAAQLIAKDHGFTVEALDARFPGIVEGIQLDLHPAKIEALRKQKDFYLRHGFIANDFDSDAWVDPRPLEAARKLAEERGWIPG